MHLASLLHSNEVVLGQQIDFSNQKSLVTNMFLLLELMNLFSFLGVKALESQGKY